MAVQRGRDLLIRMDMTGDGQFETVAGLRATRLSFNAETVDVTSLNSPGGWRELLGGAGIKSAAISGSGVFRDAETDERARAIFFSGEIPDFQVVIPDFGTVEGAFQLTALEFAGSYNGEATYEISLASAGALIFTGASAEASEPEDFMGDGGDQPPPEDDFNPDPGEEDEWEHDPDPIPEDPEEDP